MLNNIPYKKIKTVVFAIGLILFISCEEDINIVFSEVNILEEKESIVEINIPKAEGDEAISANINSALVTFSNTAINIDASNDIQDTFEKSIAQFNSLYLKFKNELITELQMELTPWEISIDGEVTYQSNNLICIAMNTYLNTGAIHGSSKITFLNFDASTGKMLDYNQFINDKEALKKFLIPYFEEEVASISIEDFKLPETIGLSDEGIIVLYNANEIPSYTDELTEFTVPFDEVKSFLKVY